tara:strand:- start:1242 stop:2891 length:1650 start_codon:yes stop_codon:yes gene_type:complete
MTQSGVSQPNFDRGGIRIPYNGKNTSKKFQYRLDANGAAGSLYEGGINVYEVLEGDLNSPNYGQPLSVRIKKGVNGGTGFVWEDVSPNSPLGQILAQDVDGDRSQAYKNALNAMRREVRLSKNSVDVHDAVLEENGLQGIVDGDNVNTLLLETALPSVEFVIEGDGEGTENKPDNNNETRKDPRKPFFGGKSIKYPANAVYRSGAGPSQDYMKFDMFKYVAPQSNYLSGYFDEDFDNAKSERGGNTSSIPKILTKGLSRTSTALDGVGGRKYLGTVKMPIPNQLETSNGVSWGEGRANAFEAAAFMGTFGAIRNTIAGGNILDQLKGTGKGVAELVNDFKDGVAGDANTLISAAASRAALSKVNINVDPNQFVTRATGKAINPNLELLFAGPRLRSFQFSFNFAPQNPEDAKRARQIMRFFKQGMLPARGTSSDLYLLSPNVFRLGFMNNGQRIKSLNAFKICALTNCAVNFTPDGMYQAYDDPVSISQPIRSIMTLGFTELTPILADDYDTESARPSVRALQDKVLEQGPLSQFFDDSSGDDGVDIGF